MSSDTSTSICGEHLAALPVQQSHAALPPRALFSSPVIFELTLQESCLLLCLSSLDFPSGLCCTALSAPAISFVFMPLHRELVLQDEVVSLPTLFLETCFFKTPMRYLRKWVFASSSSLFILKKKYIYWRMKGSLFFLLCTCFLLSFLLTSTVLLGPFTPLLPCCLVTTHSLDHVWN